MGNNTETAGTLIYKSFLTSWEVPWVYLQYCPHSYLRLLSIIHKRQTAMSELVQFQSYLTLPF